AERASKLQQMIRTPPRDPSGTSSHVAIAWPKDLLLDERHHFAGFVMPNISNGVELSVVINPADRRQKTPGFTWRYLLMAGRNIASILAALHVGDYVVGDMSERNFLISHTSLTSIVD